MKPLSHDERIQVARFRSLRDNIHSGPLYTVLGDNVKVAKPGTKGGLAVAQLDPFEGMQSYSQKYKRRERRVPKLDTRPYGSRFHSLKDHTLQKTNIQKVLQYFPKELWSTLDPSTSSTNPNPSSTAREKKLQLAPSRLSLLNADDRELLGELGGDGDNDEIKKEDGEEAPEEVDDEYASDEESMAGDYNAEQYFDDGGEDAGDDYDAGEGDAGEY